MRRLFFCGRALVVLHRSGSTRPSRRGCPGFGVHVPRHGMSGGQRRERMPLDRNESAQRKRRELGFCTLMQEFARRMRRSTASYGVSKRSRPKRVSSATGKAITEHQLQFDVDAEKTPLWRDGRRVFTADALAERCVNLVLERVRTKLQNR
jgi:ribosomal protein L44E